MQVLPKPPPPPLPFPPSMRTAREAFGLKSWWFGKCSKTTFRCTRACPDPRRSGLSRGAPRHCQASPAQRSRWPGRVSAGRPGPGSAVPHDPENFTLLIREPPAMEDFPRNGGFPLKRWWRGGQDRAGGMLFRRRGRRAGDRAALPRPPLPAGGSRAAIRISAGPGPTSAVSRRDHPTRGSLAGSGRSLAAKAPPSRPIPSSRRDSCGARLEEQ